MASNTTDPIAKKTKKKRVRFELDDNDTRQVKRRIVEIPLPKSSLLTTEEKTWYWMQPEDHRDTLHDVMALMHDCHHNNNNNNNNNNEGSSADEGDKDPNMVPFAQYAEALALTFTLCDTPPVVCATEEEQDDEEGEAPLWNIRDSHSVAQLALWASNHTPTRGVESKILPGLHQERQLRRSRAIQGVLEAQSRLSSTFSSSSAGAASTTAHEEVDNEKISCLGAVSRALSHSAKQFATALAVVDGTQAYLEYTRNDATAAAAAAEAAVSADPEESSATKEQPEQCNIKDVGVVTVTPAASTTKELARAFQ